MARQRRLGSPSGRARHVLGPLVRVDACGFGAVDCCQFVGLIGAAVPLVGQLGALVRRPIVGGVLGVSGSAQVRKNGPVSELASWLLKQIDYDDHVGVLAGIAFGGEWSGHRRRIVGQCQEWLAYDPTPVNADGSGASYPEAADIILRLLAMPYADRPNYLNEWRP